ncbi:hypothetical protein VTK26DRAFT_8573 [Humicola hyalothermophila]
MGNILQSGPRPSQAALEQTRARAAITPYRAVQTNYSSNPVTIPPSFLRIVPSSSARLPLLSQSEEQQQMPITYAPIDFAKSQLPEYDGMYAAVLDNVLSQEECDELIRLAESSVPVGEGEDPWAPAMVNVGEGREMLMPNYRNGERIIWDCQEVADRIWERCLQVRELRELFGEVGGEDRNIFNTVGRRDGTWKFLRVNDRLRFLRYGKGGFFKPHCDGVYVDTSDPSRTIKTMFTIQLYLNDSKAEAGPGSTTRLLGGATTFLSNDERRWVDVNPKAGRVLIFQHRRLYHAGDEVLAGTKYTVRTDIMYEFVKNEGPSGEEEGY